MNLSLTSRQDGFSLVELSVATAIYALGLGSLSLMMLLAVRGTGTAGDEAAATFHGSSLAEMILMHSDAIGHYALPSENPAVSCDGLEGCSAEEMAAWQLHLWQQKLADDLPGGHGLVCRDSTPHDGAIQDPACDGTGGYVVKIFWSDPDTMVDGNRISDRQVFSLSAP
jgi:Tfp pilus assembly protein PilV